MFIETSAKVGHNVKLLFKRIAQALPGMDEAGGQDRGQSEFAFVFSKEKLTIHTVIDVNINPNPPQANDGCSC